jgi:hypothetical protein
MSWLFGKSKKQKAAEEAAARAGKAIHANELKFGESNEVFTDADKKRLRKRYDAIANGRDHILKTDFLDQPEVGTNPLLQRVVDVVLEDNGHATRRSFEGPLIECSFDNSERERITGLEWDPFILPSKENNMKGLGMEIEQVTPGSVAALKGHLHAKMKLIAVRFATDKRGTWNYTMGLPFNHKTCQIVRDTKGKYNKKRPMTLLLQDPEDPSIAKSEHEKLVAVDVSYGGGGHKKRHDINEKHRKKVEKRNEAKNGKGKRKGKEGYNSDSSDSEDEEERKNSEQKEAEKWKIRQYEVEFNDPKLGFDKRLGQRGFGLKLGPVENKLGARVEKIQPDSFACDKGVIKVGHYIIGIGKKDATTMSYEKIKQALVTVLKKKSRPIVLKFEVKVRKAASLNTNLDADGGHSDDLRPSHCFMQRQYLNHTRLTFEDFLNILAVSTFHLFFFFSFFLFFFSPTSQIFFKS